MSEIAYRIANIDSKHLRQVCKKWFQGVEPSVTNWGPAKGMEEVGAYKYFKVNSAEKLLHSQMPHS